MCAILDCFEVCTNRTREIYCVHLFTHATPQSEFLIILQCHSTTQVRVWVDAFCFQLKFILHQTRGVECLQIKTISMPKNKLLTFFLHWYLMTTALQFLVQSITEYDTQCPGICSTSNCVNESSFLQDTSNLRQNIHVHQKATHMSSHRRRRFVCTTFFWPKMGKLLMTTTEVYLFHGILNVFDCNFATPKPYLKPLNLE